MYIISCLPQQFVYNPVCAVQRAININTTIWCLLTLISATRIWFARKQFCKYYYKWAFNSCSHIIIVIFSSLLYRNVTKPQPLWAHLTSSYVKSKIYRQVFSIASPQFAHWQSVRQSAPSYLISAQRYIPHFGGCDIINFPLCFVCCPEATSYRNER